MDYETNSNTYQRISAALDSLEQDELLCNEDNFVARIKALDFLELQMIGGIEPVNSQRAHRLKQKLDNANERLFARLLASIRANDRVTLKQYLRRYEQQVSTRIDEQYVGYDEIDMLVWGLLEVDLIPEEPEVLEPDMVFYQPSSTRTILKLINELETTVDDIFYDLGSGLGHVPIMVNLLTDVRTKGVEIQEFYCRYSNKCLGKLGLSTVEFMNADARDVEYDDGTIFYMYTPFRGKVLQQVLVKLEEQSKRRHIRVCTVGPCTAEVGDHTWLHSIYLTGKNEGALGIFSSR